MSTETYNALEGTFTVRGAASSSRTGATNAVAIVGGYDANNAASSVTAGEATKITEPTTAEDTFGDSEIPRLAQAISANGVAEMWGVPVEETSVTGEDPSAGTSGELDNAPVFNPDLHPDHDITDQNGNTINVSYDVASETISGTEGYVNPVNGNFSGDGSTTYALDYDYGDYASAIGNAADLDVRYVYVGTENDTVKSTLVSDLESISNDADFKRGVTGASPEIAVGSISSYTPTQQDWRLIEVAPALGTGPDGDVRASAAVCGFMASQPIGPDGSGLYDAVGGLDSVNTEYRPSEAKNFTAVTSLTRNGIIATADTTSSDSRFQPIYATEIVDEVSLDLTGVAREYAGGPQDVNELQTLLEVQCEANSRGSPPNLGFAQETNENPYDVSVTLDPNDNSIADASVTIVPYPIAETVNVDLTVADGFVEFNA